MNFCCLSHLVGGTSPQLPIGSTRRKQMQTLVQKQGVDVALEWDGGWRPGESGGGVRKHQVAQRSQ